MDMSVVDLFVLTDTDESVANMPAIHFSSNIIYVFFIM